MSFRVKTILGIAIIEAILLFVLIVSSLRLLQTSNAEELQKRTYTTAQLFATTSKDAVLATDVGSLESFVREVLTNPGIVYARVGGRDGVVLAQGGDTAALARPFTADTRYEDVNDGIFDAYADIAVDGVSYGRVDIGFSVDAIRAVLADARNKTVAIAITEMLLVALFSYVLGMYLTKGLGQLKQATQRIATGELGHEIPVRGKDELAQTALAFNDMSRKLKMFYDERKRAEDALSKLNEDLERRVLQRTQELARAYEKIEYQALHDALTKLPNRNLFQDRLQQAILTGDREKRQFALVMMDLNRFKEINDALGHHAGDTVLQETALRLRSGLRQSDTIARLGGDEFALLLPTIKDTTGALLTLDKILQLFEKPTTIDGHAIYISASLGLVLFPKDGSDAATLVRHADTAMYDAKRRKVGHALYTADLEQSGMERMTLQNDLRAGIGRDELVLHYQPKIDLTTDRISGVEALVRWQHPQRGLLFPDDFLPLAEQAGLIKPLTDWVLHAALRQCKQWENAGLDLTVSVNASSTNLQDPSFPDAVDAALRASGVGAHKLEVEITETSIMVEPPRAIAAITKISALGVQIIIDDFGTGYSSMAYLKRLPIAKIKVDKSFVRDMLNDQSDAVIVRSIIGLGHNLGLNVVAEGVENDEIWDRLKTLGCDSAQGYCMSRPIPAADIPDWVRNSPWGRSARATDRDRHTG